MPSQEPSYGLDFLGFRQAGGENVVDERLRDTTGFEFAADAVSATPLESCGRLSVDDGRAAIIDRSLSDELVDSLRNFRRGMSFFEKPVREFSSREIPTCQQPNGLGVSRTGWRSRSSASMP